MNDNKLHEIYHAFDGKLVGTFEMKLHVCKVLANMPREVIEFVTKSCWFMSSMDDSWAYAFRGDDLKNQHLIFLSDHLLSQDEAQIHYTVAHEIGHAYLRHRNSVFINQSKEEIRQQETEADQFAKRYA
ncbi:M48 family metalloprotease [Patescibacteria group bacterium]|nr:M48 family metalloprotease [Patescibacteria group bacterium]